MGKSRHPQARMGRSVCGNFHKHNGGMIMLRILTFITLAYCGAAPTAHGYVLAIAGAQGFGDQPFIDLIQQVASDEELVFEFERPSGCTNFYTSPTVGADVLNGDGFIILLAPTGPVPGAPDWPLARIDSKQRYRISGATCRALIYHANAGSIYTLLASVMVQARSAVGSTLELGIRRPMTISMALSP